MTYREWEEILLGYLKSLTADEKKEIKEYYREIHSDKKESGMTDGEITREFGDPKICAARILMESGENSENYKTSAFSDEKIKRTEKSARPKEPEAKVTAPSSGGVSVGGVVGMIFLVLLLIIPIEAVFLSIVVSFGAVAVSGAAMIGAGALATVLSPFTFAVGYSFAGFIAALGVSIATAGVGAILVSIFVPLTKYSAIGFFKITKLIFKKR